MNYQRIASGCVPTLLLLSFFGRPVQAQPILRWKLEKGIVLRYRIEEEAKLGSDKRGLTEKLVMETSWIVTEAQDDTWQIAVKVERIRFTASGDVGGGKFEVVYDSSDKSAKGHGAKALSELFNAIVDCKIQLKLDSLGKITDPELPKNLVNQFNQNASVELAGFFGDTVSMIGLKRSLYLVAVPLPEGTVSAGDKWKHEFKLKLAQGFLTGISDAATYSYLGRESGRDGPEEKIRVQSQEEVASTRKGQEGSRKSEANGVAYFDNSNGFLAKRTSTRKQGNFVTIKTTVERISRKK
jgi:hypothetical protein